MNDLAMIPGRRAVRWLDGVAVGSVALFTALGVITGVLVSGLARFGTRLGDVARSLDEAARGIAGLGQVPLVGSSAVQLADGVARAAASLGTTAADLPGRAVGLAIVLGVAIAVQPLPLAVGVYLPLRLIRHRQLRALRALRTGPADPALVEHLARSAVRRMGYRELRLVSRSPERDLAAGAFHHLAAAELRRLGVAPPPGWSVDTTSGQA